MFLIEPSCNFSLVPSFKRQQANVFVNIFPVYQDFQLHYHNVEQAALIYADVLSGRPSKHSPYVLSGLGRHAGRELQILWPAVLQQRNLPTLN